MSAGDPRDDDTESRRAVERVALVGIAVSVVLVALKVVLAISSSSLVVTASAVDSAVDVVGAVVLWFGLHISGRKTQTFPYGLHKIENLLQVGIAILIFVGAYEIARQAFFGRDNAPTITWWVMAGMAASIAITWGYGHYAVRAGKRTGSPALKADGRHRQTDVASTVVALAAVVSIYLGFNIDRYAAIPILLFIIYTGWGLLASGMKVLLDASIDADTLVDMRRMLEAEPLVTQVQSLTARNAGRFLFVEATVSVRTDDLEKAHAASDRIEQTIRNAYPRVDRIVIHLEPREKAKLRLAVPVEPDGTKIYDDFGAAPRFLLLRMDTDLSTVHEHRTVANPHATEEKQKGILTAEWLVGLGVDAVIVPGELNKGPQHVFHEAAVAVYLSQSNSVEDEVRRLAGEHRDSTGQGHDLLGPP